MGKKVEQWTVTGNNKTFWLGVLISILLSILFISISELIKIDYSTGDVVSFFSALLIVTTLYFYSKSYIQSFEINDKIYQLELKKIEENKNYRTQKNLLEKVKYSYDLTSEWHNPEMTILVTRAKLLFSEWDTMNHANRNGGLKNPKEFEEFLDAHPEKRQAILTILNYFEHVCILIDKDIAIEDCIKSSFSHLFTLFLSKTGFYIEYLQDLNSDKGILSNFTKYANKWSIQY